VIFDYVRFYSLVAIFDSMNILLLLIGMATAGINLPANCNADSQDADCVEVGFINETPPEVEHRASQKGFICGSGKLWNEKQTTSL